jgi:hypothetical protein
MHELGHTPYIEKQIVELVVASLATNIVFGTNYMCIGSQNDPTPHEHVVQGFHILFGKVVLVFIHSSTPVLKNYLPI